MPFRISPYTTSSLARGGWFDDSGFTVFKVNFRDMIASEGGIIDFPGGRSGDAVRPYTAGRLPDFHRTSCRYQLSVKSALPGKPHSAPKIEGKFILFGTRCLFKTPHFRSAGPS